MKTYSVAQVTRKKNGDPGDPGKSAVIDAYRLTRAAGALSSVNSGGRRSIIFCVDRDVDEKHSPHEHESHFCVTHLRDAEAEVFANADVTKALQHLLSIDSATASARARAMRGWIEQLATTWAEWIILGAVAANARSTPSGTWAGRSLVNDPWHGPIDRAKHQIHEGRLIAVAGTKAAYRTNRRQARAVLRANQSRAGRKGLVKGKWLPAWLGFVAATNGSERASLERSALVAFAGSLNYSESWADPYRTKMAEAMLRYVSRG